MYKLQCNLLTEHFVHFSSLLLKKNSCTGVVPVCTLSCLLSVCTLCTFRSRMKKTVTVHMHAYTSLIVSQDEVRTSQVVETAKLKD